MFEANTKLATGRKRAREALGPRGRSTVATAFAEVSALFCAVTWKATILIHGGAGAVGAYAAQWASHGGATVIATAGGADQGISPPSELARLSIYREAEFEKVLREKVDVVFDLVGGDTQKRSFLVLKEGGHLVAATQPVPQEETARHRVTGVMMRLAPSGDVLGRIARLLEAGTIRPNVANVYALEDVAQA
jgi:NADPH:quinone reductase-like Zn-dependent oxidoreductase